MLFAVCRWFLWDMNMLDERMIDFAVVDVRSEFQNGRCGQKQPNVTKKKKNVKAFWQTVVKIT